MKNNFLEFLDEAVENESQVKQAEKRIWKHYLEQTELLRDLHEQLEKRMKKEFDKIEKQLKEGYENDKALITALFSEKSKRKE